jgi:hypothetical protein
MVHEALSALPPEAIATAAAWHPCPCAGERAAWEALPQAVRDDCLQAGAGFLGHSWPPLPACGILDFRRSGNRTRHEAAYFGRRGALVALVLAECCEGRGRFLDDIVNGIWAICEETSWCLPAHEENPPGSAGLPDADRPVVDLFAAETGATLAWLLYLLAPALDGVSTRLTSRLRREVERRVLAPALARDDFWWLGLGDPPRRLNNWTPWIVSNWLSCILLLENDAGRRRAALLKAAGCLDRFLAGYPADGGCDEGPGYWGRAGASLLEALELLRDASRGRLDFFDRPLIRAIGRYIVGVHIADDWFVNFADASARVHPPAHIVHGYGLRTGDDSLRDFGLWLAAQPFCSGGHRAGSDLGRSLSALFRFPLRDEPPLRPPLPRDVWLPVTEVMVARDRAGDPGGWFLAAKGGHNGESHNHNDIGSFIVHLDGRPLLVDAGVGEYTRQTFGPERYDIWTMRSDWHNLLPAFDGVVQSPGRRFRAGNVRRDAGEAAAELALDLQGAYPPEAAARRWRRRLCLTRGRGVTVEDHFDLAAVPGVVSLALLTPSAPALAGGGEVLLASRELPGGRRSADGILRLAAPGLELETERLALTDGRLAAVWGDRLAVIRLRLRRPPARGVLRLEIARRTAP